MTHNNCLNCEKELTGVFCSGCGQKADTHRISIKNFVTHDLLHGAFHIDKGMLFTARQALLRPGKASLDYIAGKRKRYYNVFYLIVITIGLMLFIRHFGDLFDDPADEIVHKKVYINEASKKLDEMFTQKSKIILLLFLPCAAVNSFILFRRKKLNLSEHFILSGMILLGMLLISCVANIVFYITWVTPISGVFLSWLVTAAIFFYVGFAYQNAFGGDYSKFGIAYRILLYYLLVCLQTAILLFIMMGIASNWKYGQITIAPFS